MEKEPMVVNIDGKRYLLPAQEDKEHIQQIAELTDRRIRETRVANPALSREEAAVSAALSIADELVRANHELLRLRKRSKQPSASEKS